MTGALLPGALLDPAAFPHPPAEVTLVETHISWVFFAGDLVYKVKKPVRFPFLDFTGLGERRRFCEEEVRLNGALAPGVYRAVLPVARAGEGLKIGGAGEPVEWAVEMRRLPADGMLDRLLRNGPPGNALLDSIARLLARFHAGAPTGAGVDGFAEPEALRARVFETIDEGRRSMPPELHAYFAMYFDRFLREERPLLERRIREGRIREGHGDVHAGNVCVAPEGVVVYDRIEFSRAFRCGDVAYEIAFLAMDLDRHGFFDAARRFVQRYAEEARDPEMPRLVRFYKTHRALIRGVVHRLQGREEEALRYLSLAAGYLLPPSLLLACGLPATGKSRFAREFGEAVESVVLRSDAVRKELLGIAPGERWKGGFREGPYSPEATDRTYAELLERAKRALEEGRTVVVDATFPSPLRRSPFRAMARRRGAPFLLAHLTAPEGEIRRRMEERARDRGEISDAGMEVYLRARSEFAPPDEIPEEEKVGTSSRTVHEALLRLCAQVVRKFPT